MQVRRLLLWVQIWYYSIFKSNVLTLTLVLFFLSSLTLSFTILLTIFLHVVCVFMYVYTIHIHSHGQGAVLPENEEKSDGESITQRLCFCSSFLSSHSFTVLLIFLHVYVCTPFWTCHFSLSFHCLKFSWLIHWLLDMLSRASHRCKLPWKVNFLGSFIKKQNHHYHEISVNFGNI